MSAAADDSDDDALALPEPEPRPSQSPGLARWTGTRDNGPPPYEDSSDQIDARRCARFEADVPSVERRRLRIARIAKRREAAAQRALARGFDEAAG